MAALSDDFKLLSLKIAARASSIKLPEREPLFLANAAVRAATVFLLKPAPQGGYTGLI
jgi:hypothetical protein